MNEKIIIDGYKCFQKSVVVEKPSLLNLIIGRNNSGKTTLMDAIEYLYSDEIFEKKIEKAGYVIKIDENGLDSIGEYITRYNYYKGTDLGLRFPNTDLIIGRDLGVFIEREKNTSRVFASKLKFFDDSVKNELTKFGERDTVKLINFYIGPIKKFTFKKISAERDIYEEEEQQHATITTHGEGITKKIDELINVDGQNYKLIKNDLLNDLNKILHGENSYSEITIVKNSQNKKKSLCLVENGVRVRLNEMGSGVKTIIFVLLLLLLQKDFAADTVFVFEELENNLHPEIQRRLFEYIYDYSITNKAHIFITSHSNVPINCYYGRDNTSIYHVYKDSDGSSNVEKVESYNNKINIIDDLGFKASDLFQTNGIIWVEGPSDRIYIKKWLAVLFPDLEENIDFTFLYYGGKNLAHYTASEEEEKELINVLLTNRNGYIVMDHDENSEEDPIRQTKQRIRDEFSAKNMGVWVTKGKEIENYLTAKDLNAAFNTKSLKQVGTYEKFQDYINDTEPNFVSKKVSFAKKIAFTEESLNYLDLEVKITEMAKFIKKWNSKY